MANKLYNQLNPNTSGDIGSVMPQNQNTTQIMQPKEKPTIADIIQDVQKNGGDARGLFFKRANEMGIPTKPIIDYLKNNKRLFY